MFDFLVHAPVDHVVVAANHVIRAIEYRADISDCPESEDRIVGQGALSYDEQIVATSIANEIRQIERLPISYLTDEAASEYTSRLAHIVQRSIQQYLSNQEIESGREILRQWQQDDPEDTVEDSQADSTRLTYFLIGAGIGAVLAFLFAPKSGEELRNDIAAATQDKAGEYYGAARETAEEYYEATRERATDLYDTATAKAGEVVRNTRDAATRQAGSISVAVEAGKKAYVEEKRKTELSGRTKAAPTYRPERAM